MKKKKSFSESKKEIEKVNPLLMPPSTSVEENLSRGIEDMIPDPDDVPNNLNQDANLASEESKE